MYHSLHSNYLIYSVLFFSNSGVEILSDNLHKIEVSCFMFEHVILVDQVIIGGKYSCNLEFIKIEGISLRYLPCIVTKQLTEIAFAQFTMHRQSNYHFLKVKRFSKYLKLTCFQTQTLNQEKQLAKFSQLLGNKFSNKKIKRHDNNVQTGWKDC